MENEVQAAPPVVAPAAVAVPPTPEATGHSRPQPVAPRTVTPRDGTVHFEVPVAVVHIFRVAGYRVEVQDAVGWIRAGRTSFAVRSERGTIKVMAPGGSASRISAGETRKFARNKPSAPDPEEPLVSTWKSSAAKGEYAVALDAALAEDFDALTKKLGPGDLKRLADVARYAKHPARARQALEALRTRHRDSEEARLAAFLLGKIASASAANRRQAESWFQTYLEENPQGRMVAESRGRLMELRKLRGANAAAEAAATEYLAHHPHGSYADLARTILAR